MASRKATQSGFLAILLALLPAGVGSLWAEAEEPRADVVVVVDTSGSMREPGMDPERASLLVTKLFSDLVPGELAVVRLLDLVADRDLLPSRPTGEFVPCQEDPNRNCGMVEPATDWEADARKGRYGALARPVRGDEDFKKQLETHLEQRSNNSPFYLALRAAQGVFDEHESWNQDVPRTVVWLSDGRPDLPEATLQVLNDLGTQGVEVEAVVFGAGDPKIARQAGLPTHQVSGPGEMMDAFADAFRRIVRAPYELDHRLAEAPSFEMQPHVDEAWIVVYGDDSLASATLRAPDGQTFAADFATDHWPGAGAYRVAHLDRPAAGTWTVEAVGGGPETAYAVIQRSDLSPDWLEPTRAVAGAETEIVAGVRAGFEGGLVEDPELLAQMEMTAQVEGRSIPLTLDETHFRGLHSFSSAGKVPVRLHLTSDMVDRIVEAEVEVSGYFRLTSGPEEVDLGELTAGKNACKTLQLTAEHQEAVPFIVRHLEPLPAGHELFVRVPGGKLTAGAEAIAVSPGEAFEICLETNSRAPSSTAGGEPWLELTVAGSEKPEHRLAVPVRWEVHGLTFWQRWGWLILTILGLLLVLLVILGYVLPHRFRPGLAVAFGPERQDLDEQTPQPVRQWKGVGIGFYRHARAFLHPDYRLSGESRGALAGLFAESRGVRVAPGRGGTLHRETLDGDWETVPAEGRRARGGDVYRVSDRGPFFRISSRGGRP